jgi:hypothetical protein
MGAQHKDLPVKELNEIYEIYLSLNDELLVA